jgi:transposase InsO family protein/dUTPase
MNPEVCQDPNQGIPSELVGEPNEVRGSIAGKRCTALVDSGSQVTTVAEHFYTEHLSTIELHDCKDLLRIEGASGDLIPYAGYIFAEVCLEGAQAVEVPVLVVKTTAYNTSVPLLVGTNFLQRMQGNPTMTLPRVLQLARQSVELVDRHLKKSNGVYGVVYAAEDIRIRPGRIKVLSGNLRLTVPISSSVTMASSPRQSSLDVTPGLINIDKFTKTAVVEIANLRDSDQVIRKGEKIAELHQVTVNTTTHSLNTEEEEFLSAFDLTQLERNSTAAEAKDVKDMVVRWKQIFSKDSADLGKTSLLKHRIDLHDNIPVKERARRIPPNLIDEVREHIQELHSMGVIEESVSPWSSPVVLVRKKSGELRMCVDYRKLNMKTIKDSYRIPTIEELVDTLNGAQWFATLDLSSGYHQVEIEESDKEKTAFTAGPLGFWQYTRMPFGLTNAPALFQRLMERVLSGVHLKTALVYLDDIVVFGASIPELKDRLEEVFRKIHQAGLKLKAKKCTLFKQQLRYLGHIVSAEGVSCDPDMLAPVKEWKSPTCVKDLQRFLGFANFFRRFIKDFASIAYPLTALMGSESSRKGRKKVEAKPWTWEEKEEASFEKLKEALTSPPLLVYPDFAKPFIVRTDASIHGLGAVLCQDNGEKAGAQVIAYASRSLRPAEKNYSPYKLEFLALYWAVTDKFQDYLKGSAFTVWTDHNPLTYILTSAKLDAAGHRWLQQLNNFNFSVKYKPGRHNTDADALSRMSEESVRVVCNSFDDSADMSGHCMAVHLSSTKDYRKPNASLDWKHEQDQDPDMRRAREILQGNMKVRGNTEEAGVKQILRKRRQIHIEDGILYRKTTQSAPRILVPSHLRTKILTMCHEDMGHQGRDRTSSILTERFFWPNMGKSVEEHLLACGRCTRAKTPHLPHRAPLHPIVATEPLELVCMDYMSLESAKGGFSSILVITDHFTKFAVAVPTRNQKASTTAKALLEHFIYPYGIPRRLHSDQGANFESRIIQKMCELHGILKSRTTPYHPEGDGETERMNRTLLGMLRTLDEEGKQDWKAHVGRLLHAYNTTTHSSTGYSPYLLMFGRKPNLPVDALLPKRKQEDNMATPLKDTHQSAKQNNDRARLRQKRNYDVKVRGGTLQVGDQVLVRKLAFKGSHKLEDRWESEPYIVVAKENPDIPVYIVESREGKRRTLHRNHLLALPLQELVDPQKKITPKPNRNGKYRATKNTGIDDIASTEDDSSDEDKWIRRQISFMGKKESRAGETEPSKEEASEADSRDLQHEVSQAELSEDVQTEESEAEPNGIEPSETESETELNEPNETDSSESEQYDTPADQSDEEIQTEGSEAELNETELSEADSNESRQMESQSDQSEVDVRTREQSAPDLDLKNEQSPPAQPRRSTRVRRSPDRFGNAISHQHTVHLADLKERVYLLVSLIDSFPDKRDEIYSHAVNMIIK